MPNNKLIAEIMTPTPVVGNLSNKFSQLLRLFREFPVHHLPIVDSDSKLIGIISTNDLPKVFLTLCSRPEPVLMTLDVIDHEVSVKEIMTPDPVTIGSRDSVAAAAAIFAEHKFLALPVVDNGVLVGIVSLKDVIGYVSASASL